MENQIYEKWHQQLITQLEVIVTETETPAERLHSALDAINKTIDEIKLRVTEDGFQSPADEIYFFKHVKPQLYALRQYELLHYSLAINTPSGTQDMLRQFYEQELLFVFRQFRGDPFHYHYYKAGSSELDERYFLRNSSGGEIPVLEITDYAPGFSSPLDYSFSRFIAFERLQDYLLEQLDHLIGDNPAGRKAKPKRKTVKWTGEAINLVEIAYGIWLTGQVNNGNASISEIISWMEVNFQVKIGLAFRRWAAISGRKRISVTKFLDQMKAAVLKRIDDELSL